MTRWMCALVLALGFASKPALAQDFPSKPITMIVVFAAGGPTDVLARLVADHMGNTLGQRVLIENVAGAGGTTGGTRGARATPDGYTLTVGSLGSHAAAAALYKDIQYDSRELEPVGLIAGTPGYFAVRKEFPAKTFQEFLAYAKANPGKVTNGHAGVGSTPHLACLLLESLTQVKIISAAYRGSGPAMNDLVAGQIDTMCDLAPTVVPQVQGGTIRGLLLAQPERSPATPDVPTSKEAGLEQYQFTGWNAVFAPKGTPREATQKLSDALKAAVSDAVIRKRIAELGAIPAGEKEMGAAYLGPFVKNEVERWGKVIGDAKVTAQ